MVNFATAQDGKHGQHVIELFATKGILIKTPYLNKSIFENIF